MTALRPADLAGIRRRAADGDAYSAVQHGTAGSEAVRRWARDAQRDRSRLLAELERVTDAAERTRREISIVDGLPDPATRRSIRETSGLSQARLARAVGVSRQAISQWETGARAVPRGPLLDKYVLALRALAESGAR